MLTLLKRISQAAWQGLKRNRWITIACIVMMVVSLIIFSSVLIFNHAASSLIKMLKDKMDISIYFKTDVPEEDIFRIRDELIGREEIAKIDYVSREDALKRFRERNAKNQVIQKALEELGENPLSASLNIKARDPKGYQKIIDFINNSNFKNKLITVDLTENQQVLARIGKLARGIRLGSFAFIGILTFLSIIISFNSIRMAIYSLREEVEIMRLVGASNWFIRGPFLLEGAMQGLIASLVATAILIPSIFWIGPKIEEFAGGLNINLYFWSHFWYIFLAQSLFGIALGVIASFWAVNKYLKI